MFGLILNRIDPETQTVRSAASKKIRKISPRRTTNVTFSKFDKTVRVCQILKT